MRRERDLERRLREARIPDEAAAESRAWEMVRAAYAERSPARPRRPARRAAIAVAVGAAVLAVGLSPAGARVADVVRDVVGAGDAEPVLTSLPAPGEILVESESGGVWIARADGSKRHLGDFEQATWSPRGLYVGVTSGHELAAVDPAGEVRWSLARPRPLSDPRWSAEPGYRVAYRAGRQLRVVAGDGTGDRLLARDAARIAPAWRPVRPEDLKGAGPGPGTHVLAYVRRDNRVRVVDADSARRIPTAPLDPGPGDRARVDRGRSGADDPRPPLGPAASGRGKREPVLRAGARRADDRGGDLPRRQEHRPHPQGRRSRRAGDHLPTPRWRRSRARSDLGTAGLVRRPRLVAGRALASRLLAGGRPVAVHPPRPPGPQGRRRRHLAPVRPDAAGEPSFPRIAGWIDPERP